MLVRVYGRADCDKCTRAKEKLDRMQIAYENRNIDQYLGEHKNWRSDGSIELMVHVTMLDADELVNGHVPLPIIQIDDDFYGYADAMREFKQRGYSIRKQVETIRTPAVAVA